MKRFHPFSWRGKRGVAARHQRQATQPGIGLESLEGRTLLAFTVTPTAETDPVPHSGDALDDAAVWVHPTDPAQSTIIGSDKDGGLAVYDLSGDELQYVSIGEVNNVDLRHGFPLGGQSVDLVVANDRSTNVLVVYKVNPATRTLENVAARPLASNLGEVYGLAMYRSPASGRFYAFTSDRDDGRVEQWELFDDGSGRVDGRVVRTFDAGGTVEGMVADDETGALYAGEETGGLWKYGAEPDAGTARTMLDTTDSGGRLTADLEGLAIYYAAGGGGYLLASNQGANEFMIYDRRSGAFLDRFTVSSGTIDGVNDTDGIEVASFGLGPQFPSGLFVAQDYSNGSSNQNFKVVDWADIAAGATPDLLIDTTQDPRTRGGTTVTAPEVDVWYGPVQLSDGTGKPTSFGSRQQFRNAVVYPFTVRNTGNSDLALGSAVLADNTGFEIARQLPPLLAPGDSATLYVRMPTDTVGQKSARVSFATSDADESPFDFIVAGAVTAIPPEIQVLDGNGAAVQDGATTPLDFGTAAQGSAPVERTFTIRNDGASDLYVRHVQLLNNSGFEVVRQPYHYLTPGGVTTFVLRMRTGTAGPTSADVRFDNTDGDENPFDFRVTGSVTAPDPAGGDGEIVYSGPLVVTQGGTYSGNWESLDPAVPAVTVRTSEPVVIENANLRGRGDLIKTAAEHADLTVRNTRGYALNPDVYGVAPGRFLEAYRFDNVVLENNYLEGTGGIKLLEYLGDGTAADGVRVVGNAARNIDGRKSDGAGGFLDFNERTRLSDGVTEDGYKIRQFLQLDKVQGVPGVEVAWNQVVNEPGLSRIEDTINIYRSSGTADSPIRIHDNYIQGAYTVRPWQGGTTADETWSYDWGYAGGGILLGDGSSGVAYVRAYDNQVVSTTNYGIAIAAGHDSSFYRNRVVSSGRLADGRPIAEQNVGVYIWDLYDTGSASFYNNGGSDNRIGWVKDASASGSGGDRNDWWVPDATTFENNVNWPGEITLQTEADEFTLWQQKLASAGLTVGPVA